MDRFCFCLRTGTPSSTMETKIGKACSSEDMNISHTKTAGQISTPLSLARSS